LRSALLGSMDIEALRGLAVVHYAFRQRALSSFVRSLLALLCRSLRIGVCHCPFALFASGEYHGGYVSLPTVSGGGVLLLLGDGLSEPLFSTYTHLQALFVLSGVESGKIMAHLHFSRKIILLVWICSFLFFI
jgi:hypothetical protein